MSPRTTHARDVLVLQQIADRAARAGLREITDVVTDADQPDDSGSVEHIARRGARDDRQRVEEIDVELSPSHQRVPGSLEDRHRGGCDEGIRQERERGPEDQRDEQPGARPVELPVEARRKAPAARSTAITCRAASAGAVAAASGDRGDVDLRGIMLDDLRSLRPAATRTARTPGSLRNVASSAGPYRARLHRGRATRRRTRPGMAVHDDRRGAGASIRAPGSGGGQRPDRAPDHALIEHREGIESVHEEHDPVGRRATEAERRGGRARRSRAGRGRRA